jgi:hypothetical protein
MGCKLSRDEADFPVDAFPAVDFVPPVKLSFVSQLHGIQRSVEQSARKAKMNRGTLINYEQGELKRRMIVDYLAKYHEGTSVEIANHIGCTKESVRGNASTLKKDGIITATGNSVTTWRLA